MKWVTRERPKIDRIACPWLIRRFIDRRATILYVPEKKVLTTARRLNAVPFDVPGVELTHRGSFCTFDAIIRKYKLTRDPALRRMAVIVRGADTDRHDIAAQSAGLWAISAGLARNIRDDQKLLATGMVLYDALYTWAKELTTQRHTSDPSEAFLLRVYRDILRRRSGSVPRWATQLKTLIQDQIDTNMVLRQKELSRALKVHPSYLSRSFSKYFDNLRFGEYIQRLRIRKARKYLERSHHTLAEIAYLTGFSDQSHFSRVFKKQTGTSPASYRSRLPRGKNRSTR